jgi:hypothetical protein
MLPFYGISSLLEPLCLEKHEDCRAVSYSFLGHLHFDFFLILSWPILIRISVVFFHFLIIVEVDVKVLWKINFSVIEFEHKQPSVRLYVRKQSLYVLLQDWFSFVVKLLPLDISHSLIQFSFDTGHCNQLSLFFKKLLKILVVFLILVLNFLPVIILTESLVLKVVVLLFCYEFNELKEC